MNLLVSSFKAALILRSFQERMEPKEIPVDLDLDEQATHHPAVGTGEQ
jgi:hypothetical protein